MAYQQNIILMVEPTEKKQGNYKYILFPIHTDYSPPDMKYGFIFARQGIVCLAALYSSVNRSSWVFFKFFFNFQTKLI